MGYNSEIEVLEALICAYYEERNIEKILSCVTVDVEWIGTENDDSASGKDDLEKLLYRDIALFPDPFLIQMEEPSIQKYGEDIAIINILGKQVLKPEIEGGFTIRGTVCCVKTKSGWLISSVHTSVPNSELEKIMLEQELDMARRQEQTLISGIPGGIAIYHLRSDGTVPTEYVSEGLAKICGYTTAEFLDLLREDSTVNVVKEDIPFLMESVKESLENNEPICARYRVYNKEHEPILIRLDANVIKTDDLEDGDEAVLYAVHTKVSEEAINLIDNAEKLKELVDEVPSGIGIYEIIDGKAYLTYLNEAYFKLIGKERAAIDWKKSGSSFDMIPESEREDVFRLIDRLIDGSDYDSMVFSTKNGKGETLWIQMRASVIERQFDCIRVFTTYSDYSEIMKAQLEQERARKVLYTSLEASDSLTWIYDRNKSSIVNTLTWGEYFQLPKVIENVPDSLIEANIIEKGSVDDFLALYEEERKGKVSSREIQTFYQPADEYRWYKLVYTPSYNGKGDYVETIGTAIDITEQKVREQKYEEQLKLNQMAAQDSLSKVYLNLSKNQVLSYDYISDDFEGHKKYDSANELLSSINNDIKSEIELKKFSQVSDCESIIKAYKKGNAHMEITCHIFEKSQWLRVIYDIMENPYSGDIEMISSVHDVTRHVRTELVINKLLDVQYKAIFLINNNTGVVYPYEKETGNRMAKEINQFIFEEGSQVKGLERYFTEHTLESERARTIRHNHPDVIKEQIDKYGIYENAYTYIDRGDSRKFKLTYSNLEEDEQILLLAIQDVTTIYEKETEQQTQLSKALEEAKLANRAKTDFLSRVSHDMRTPLNGILGLTTLLIEKGTDDDEIKDLRQLQMSGQYLLNLINDTLDVNKIESGKIEMNPTVCDGRTVFGTITNLIKPNLLAKHITFNVKAENLPFTLLYMDVGRVEQIVMNILGNAVKFTPEGGTIDFIMENISVKDGIITDLVTIKDSGVGMSEEFLPKLFEPFSQENQGKTNSYEGTGLGMTITKNILEIMGGEIFVESEVGKGTTFSFTLPMKIASKEQVEAWKKEKAIISKDISLTEKRILLCEDHPLNAQIATRLLEKKGILVEHAENGKIAVDMFEEAEDGYYDLILMDIRMPQMDGLEATRTIRSLPKNDAAVIPIIAMTANALEEDVKQTKDAGMDDHLGKPIQPDIMFNTIETMLHLERKIHRRTILVVDDIEVNRVVIRATLNSDYNILEASNGKEALQILEEKKGIDVVITDIQMNEMDGAELIKEIRKVPEYDNIVIIANTQFGDRNQEEHLLSLGANDFVYKPMTPKIIGIRVKNALNR